ncbi:hypothetical protein BD311DRAFT_780582 [Dichomitus squalens]|uniref:Uncharacterized protein n=1 Tax=Dichomitus squalens TaxID=114155 RepID=A0A4Q9MCW4_9APHY|nr:hypothetical protein BD311DRAFT_780582 [Dichomitus squalens]
MHKRARLSEDMAKGGAIDNEMLDNTSSSTDPGKHQNCTGIQVAASTSEQPQSASRRRRRRAWKDLTPEQQLKRVIASRIRRARKLASSALTEERTTPTMGTSTIPEERDDSRHGRGVEEVLCENCSSRI